MRPDPAFSVAAIAVVLILIAAALPASVSSGDARPGFAAPPVRSLSVTPARLGSSVEWAIAFLAQESIPKTRSAWLAACDLGALAPEVCASPLAPAASVEDVPHVALVGDDSLDAVLTLQPETHYVSHGDFVLRGKLVVEPPTRAGSIFRLTVLGDLIIEGEVIALPVESNGRVPLARDGTSIVLEATEGIVVREGARVVAASGLDGWQYLADGPGRTARGQDGGHGGSIVFWAEGVRVDHEQTEPGRGGHGGGAFGGLGADAVGGDGGDGGTATANGAVIDGASAGNGGSATAAGGCILCDLLGPRSTSDEDCNTTSQTAPKDVVCLIPDPRDGGQSPCVGDPNQCVPSEPVCSVSDGCVPTPPSGGDPTLPSAPTASPPPGPTAPTCPAGSCTVVSPPSDPISPSAPPTPPPAPRDICPAGMSCAPSTNPSTQPTSPTDPPSCGDVCEPIVSTTGPTSTTAPTVSTTQPTPPDGGIGDLWPGEALGYYLVPGTLDVDLGDCRTTKKGRDGQGTEDGRSASNVCGQAPDGKDGTDARPIIAPLICTPSSAGDRGQDGSPAGEAFGGHGGTTFTMNPSDLISPGDGGDATSHAGAGGHGGHGGHGYAGGIYGCAGSDGGPGGNGGNSGTATGGNGGRVFWMTYSFITMNCGEGGIADTNIADGGQGGLGGDYGGRDGLDGKDGVKGVAKDGENCPQA